MDFLIYLLDQCAALGQAVRAAKAGLELDMDQETGLNAQRQSLAATLRTMAGLRASETLVPNGGTGFCFNAEGNQVIYRCGKVLFLDWKSKSTVGVDANAAPRLRTQDPPFVVSFPDLFLSHFPPTRLAHRAKAHCSGKAENKTLLRFYCI